MGLRPSSLQVGESAVSDREMLTTAPEVVPNSKLCIHVMPGFATISRDLAPAIEIGVDVVRVALSLLRGRHHSASYRLCSGSEADKCSGSS